MNYLLHVFFSDGEPESIAGACAGDFVKGRLSQTRYSPKIKKGLQLHRDLDRFAQDSPAYQQSRERLGAEFRRMSGIAMDILYDHFLAKHWSLYGTGSCAAFVQDVYAILKTFRTQLPADFGTVLSWMVKENWLLAYRDLDWIELVLERMSRRIRFENNLAQSMLAIRTNYAALESDFRLFMSQALLVLPSNAGKIYQNK